MKRDRLSRFEVFVLITILLLIFVPMVKEGVLPELIEAGRDSSAVDPGVLAVAKLGMLLVSVVALIKIWAKYR